MDSHIRTNDDRPAGRERDGSAQMAEMRFPSERDKTTKLFRDALKRQGLKLIEIRCSPWSDNGEELCRGTYDDVGLWEARRFPAGIASPVLAAGLLISKPDLVNPLAEHGTFQGSPRRILPRPSFLRGLAAPNVHLPGIQRLTTDLARDAVANERPCADR